MVNEDEIAISVDAREVEELTAGDALNLAQSLREAALELEYILAAQR